MILMANSRGEWRVGVCSKRCLSTFAAVLGEDVCAFPKSEVFDLLCFGYILLIQLDGD